jgi:hypothetical protein
VGIVLPACPIQSQPSFLAQFGDFTTPRFTVLHREEGSSLYRLELGVVLVSTRCNGKIGKVQRENMEVQREDLGGATGGKRGPVRGITVMCLLMNYRV